MSTRQSCPECGGRLSHGETCQDLFHQMLFWEAEDPARGVVHHLMVLCYHLQHPSLYSPEGLVYGMDLLKDFVDKGVTPQEVRQRNSHQLDAGRRNWKIKGTPSAHGTYTNPVYWTTTASDVVVARPDAYVTSVQAWARAAFADLRRTGNLA